MHAQPPDFLQAEVNGIETAIGPCASWKALRNISGALQVNVVQHDGYTIAAQDHVLFKEIGTHGVCQGFRGKGMFRQVAAGSTVGDNNWVGFTHREL